MNVSLIIPSYNNLRHLKNCYTSIRKYYPEVELILMDDGSTDSTWEWLNSLDDSHIFLYKSPSRVGHTILYDKGIELAKNDIVGILHADMIVSAGYLENLIKHLDKKKVVCATRIEPPLHGPGPEKIIRDFGQDFDTLKISEFEAFVKELQITHHNSSNPGMFAPWIINKEDFVSVGGHDWGFAPFPYEDSDIFQRWLLAGYELIQSRDSYVYHLTCRGHRWTEEIGENDSYFTQCEKSARLHYIKKWGSWIHNDHNQHPILVPVYNKKLVATNLSDEVLDHLSPWFNGGEDIIVEINGDSLGQDSLEIIPKINNIVKDIGKPGAYQLRNLKLIINKISDQSSALIRRPLNEN